MPGNDAEKDHSEIKCYRSTEDMLEKAAVEVVIVTTPPNTHFQIVRSALKKGKNGTKRGASIALLSLTSLSCGGKALHAHGSRG